VLVAALAAPALLWAQTPTTITYTTTNPTTLSCLPGYLWHNLATNHVWGCRTNLNPPAWVDLTQVAISGSTAGFPITETLGPVTTTLDTDTGAPLISRFDMANATEFAGLNFGLGAGLGWSFTASNATSQAYVSAAPGSSTPIDLYYQPGASAAIYNRLSINAFGQWLQEMNTSNAQQSELMTGSTYTFLMSGLAGLNGYSYQRTVDLAAGSAAETIDDPFGVPASHSLTPRGYHLPSTSVGSAATITPRGNLLQVTGAATIATITAPPVPQCIVLVFSAGATVDSGADNILLAGGADFVATADDTLSLCHTGLSWRETGRSVN
jgi:hypothetical protein